MVVELKRKSRTRDGDSKVMFGLEVVWALEALEGTSSPKLSIGSDLRPRRHFEGCQRPREQRRTSCLTPKPLLISPSSSTFMVLLREKATSKSMRGSLASLFLYLSFLYWPCSMWDLSSLTREQRSNLSPLHWKLRVLTTGPPGSSLSFFFI